MAVYPSHFLNTNVIFFQQVENGRLRGVVNDYTEGLVSETLSRWDMSKGEGSSAKPGAFRMCF